MTMITPIIGKRIFTAMASAVLLLGACSDSEPSGNDNLPTEGTEVIGFRSITEKTRALETEETNITNFRVSAVWERDAASGDYEPAFMNNVKVERSGTSWLYSPQRYWPQGGMVDFFGYSPANSVGVNSFTISGAAYDKVTIDYTVTTDHRMQEDFLVASALDKTANPVLMNFRHALSQIEFRARSTAHGVTFRIRNIELVNLDRTGTYTGTVTTPEDTEMDWSWSDNTSATEKTETYTLYMPKPFTVSYPAAAIEVPEFESLTDASVGNLMILPQKVTIGKSELYTQDDINADENDGITQGMLNQPKDLDSKFYIAVTFDSETVYYPGTGIIPFHNNVTIYIPLYVSPGADGIIGSEDDIPFEFEAGKKYTFMLELNGLDQVVFTVGETEWSTFIQIPVSGMPD